MRQQDENWSRKYEKFKGPEKGPHPDEPIVRNAHCPVEEIIKVMEE